MKSTNLMEIVADKNLLAFCGLYCGACRSYLAGKCPGCKQNQKASWCKIRSCCLEGNLQSCADCKTVELKDCRKYNSFISKVIGVVLNSNRSACIERIKLAGYDGFAREMADGKRQTLPRK
jgi:hypothetical protein